MKITFKLLLLSAALFTTDAWSAVSLQFGLANQARATNFGGFNATTGTNGMRWGIVVDTDNTGFLADGYDPISLNSNGFINASGTPTTNYYYTNPSATLTNTVGTTSAGAEPGGDGAITTIGPLDFIATVGAGDKFAIIWFDGTPGAGTHYGLFTNPAFVLPSDGNTTPYTAVFAGADPVKQANLTFTGGVIPEPSRMMLLGFGLVGFFFRRRR